MSFKETADVLPAYDLRTSSRKGRVIERLRSRQMAKSSSSSSSSNNASKVASNLQGRVDGLRWRREGPNLSPHDHLSMRPVLLTLKLFA